MWKSMRFVIPACVCVLLAGCDSDLLAPNQSLVRTEVAARAAAAPPLATAPIGPASNGTQRIVLWWTDNSKSETGWEVQRSTGASGSFTVVASLAANTSQHDDEGLASSTNYCYRVRAFKRNGSRTNYETFSNTSCSTTLGPPQAPTGVNAVPRTSTIVDVTWTDNASTEQTVRVERSGAPGGPWFTVGILGANATSFAEGSLASDAQLCYRVVAVNQYGESASIADCTAAPRAPRNVGASGSGTSIVVSWTDASSVEDGYEVQRALSGNAFSTVANLPANATSFQDGSVPPGTPYQYRVRAKKDGGFSDFAEQPSAPPAAPTNVSAIPGGSTVALVSWQSASAIVTGFRVQRSTDGEASWVDAGSVDGDQMGFDDSAREPEQFVCYRVFAFNSLGESGASNVDCTAPPLNPVNMRVDAYPNDGVLVLTFTDRSNVEGYYVVTISWCSGVCGIPREAYVASDGGETSVAIYMENEFEFVESVCAYYDGGCSDPGIWGGGGAGGTAASQAAALTKGGARAAPLSRPMTMIRRRLAPR
jgi:titin